MKKNTLLIIVCTIVILIIVTWGVKCYNKIVKAEEAVTAEWANVETQYQRRSDLIPNLVSVVKGYAEHEKNTLESIVSARANATQTKISAADLNKENIIAFQKAQGEIGSALSKLLAITENYPELKANENFLKLQEQLEGTENKIQFARQKFNRRAKEYNVFIRRFPNNILSSLLGFPVKAYFEAEDGAEYAPKIQI